jgi:hypothetical protein
MCRGLRVIDEDGNFDDGNDDDNDSLMFEMKSQIET